MTSHCMPASGLPQGLDDILGRSGVALCLADTAMHDTPLILVNPAFCNTTGYPPEEAIGRNCRFLQPPGGAGPVRARMREFLSDPKQGNGRFVVPNVTREGAPFLNVVFMAKIRCKTRPELILGSQFRVRSENLDASAYEAAVQADLCSLKSVLADGNWAIIASMEALSNTMRLVAQHRLEQ